MPSLPSITKLESLIPLDMAERSNFHLVIPASNPDPNLCKAVVSASILGYPAPLIINWNQTFDDPNLVEGGSHLAKIKGMAEYFESMSQSHDEDIVLIMDGYDAWIQLRPQTMVDRFYSINEQADKRIETEIGKQTMKSNNVSQQVIFGCQKRCWPWTFDDPPCYAVPQSSLPKDIYGNDTDTDVGDEENPYIKYRQRFLNSGVAAGTVQGLRKLFQQAYRQVPADSNFGSDQFIFSHIFGDQELYREILRRDSGLPPNENFNAAHIEEVRAKAAAHPDGNFEFGIGVDYASEIGLNTVFAEDDTDWVNFADSEQLRRVQDDRGIPAESHRLGPIAMDIGNSTPPFATSEPLDKSEHLPSSNWEHVRLFTDVYTGVAPVVIHHNAHRNGMKSLRETWWPLIWFQKYIRTLLRTAGDVSDRPIAVKQTKGEWRREYWAMESDKMADRRGVFAKDASTGNWLSFEDLCGAYEDEIFRDA